MTEDDPRKAGNMKTMDSLLPPPPENEIQVESIILLYTGRKLDDNTYTQDS